MSARRRARNTGPFVWRLLARTSNSEQLQQLKQLKQLEQLEHAQHVFQHVDSLTMLECSSDRRHCML